MKKRYKIFIVIIMIILLTSNLFLLAKYRSTISGTSTTEVAKWDNNIQIVGEDSFILNNGQVNNETLTFNLLSSSEVTSRYDICFEKINKIVGLELSNLTKTGYVKIDGTDIIVAFGNDEETFTIPNSTTTSTSGNITMSSNVVSGSTTLTFTKTNEEMNIYVKLNNSDYYDVNFNKFGTMNYGDNQSITHTAVLSTDNVQLPGSDTINLYAVFEQVD